MEEMLADSKATGCTEGWSEEFESPFLNCPSGQQGPWENSSVHNHLPTGSDPTWRSQTWFDNVKSTLIKVAMAKTARLGGVGVFTGEGAGYGKSADALWAALGSIAYDDDTDQGSDSNSSKAAKTDDNTVVKIGSSTQLFADDLIIASMTSSLKRTMHSPSMSDVVIKADRPWEQGYMVSGIQANVLHVPSALGPGKLRVWYGLREVTAYADIPTSLLAYAESTDGGRSFIKPLLNQYSLKNSTDNNIIMPVPTTSNGMGIFIDPNEPVGSPQRYRGISANTALCSPDGLNWTKTGTYAVPSMVPGVDHNPFDTQDQIFWDPRCNCYSLYARWENKRDNGSDTVRRDPVGGHCPLDGNCRMVRRARSDSLSFSGQSLVGKWTNQTLAMHADALDFAANDGETPLDYYGATSESNRGPARVSTACTSASSNAAILLCPLAWYRDQGDGFGVYYMAAVRFWHWGATSTPGAHAGCMDGLLWNKDVALVRVYL